MLVPTRWLVPFVVCMAAALLAGAPASAAKLVIHVAQPKTLTSEQLLARADVITITVPADVTYQHSMTYRAVPLRAIIGIDHLHADQDLQVTATDGFVTNLPAQLVFPPGGKGAEAWLAIEPANEPWPRSPSGASVGPFYLVWLDPSASGVVSEQWPYAVDTIRSVPSRATMWPQLAVGNAVAADSPIRDGQVLYAKQCIVCHQLNGAGDSTVGPDLNLPHGPTEYFQAWALKAFIRKPSSVRTWPEMKMPGFPKANLGDADLDAVIAYLRYMAGHRQ